MKPNLLFLTLNVFSATGGIEKVCRQAGKALHELGLENGFDLNLYSAYDGPGDTEERYLPATSFRGFGGNRLSFARQSMLSGRKATVVLLSHINLLPVGYAIKAISPRTGLVLLAHGIEVWYALPRWKKRMLKSCDLILAVSRFTKEKLIEVHGVGSESIRVVNNCLDPFLPPLRKDKASAGLLERYGLTGRHKVLFTLSRLSAKERYKGYDEVLMALKALKGSAPELRYLIIGKYDSAEKKRLDRLIRQQGLEKEVILAGFVPDEELAQHFALADIFVMPSRKEGFGIAFIEALYYGKPVIAGNVDGSVDALANGELGLLINPDNPAELTEAIKKILTDRERHLPAAEQVTRRFGYAAYKATLGQVFGPFFQKQKGQAERETEKAGGVEYPPTGAETHKSLVPESKR